MSKPLIKICGVRTPKLAQAAVAAGAALIGIICHPGSKRYVDVQIAKKIAAATRAMGGIPVAVFVDHSAAQMREFCTITAIDCVQLHGDRARSEYAALPRHYQRIYVCSVGQFGTRPIDLMRLRDGDSLRDYVLFDHEHPGSGHLFAWNHIDYRGPLRVGIAGGLNRENVGQAIARFAPAFVDISSGVENRAGEKEMTLIRDFIAAASQLNRRD